MYKNYPPVAGAIAWARALYLRQKRPIMRFRTMDRLMKRPSGEAFKAAYLEFAKAVDKYVATLYAGWADRVSALANDQLRQPLLGPRLLDAALSLQDIPMPGSAPGVTVGVAAAAAAATAAASVPGSSAAQDLEVSDGSGSGLDVVLLSVSVCNGMEHGRARRVVVFRWWLCARSDRMAW